MNPRTRKINYDLFSNPSRSILVILAIAVGLFAMGLISYLWVCVPYDMRVGYEESNPANIFFQMSPFDNALLRHVQKWPNVKDAMGSNIVNMRAYDANGSLRKITIQAVSDDSWPVNKVDIIEGEWPVNKNEVALENLKFAELGVQIGDQITVKTPAGDDVQLTVKGRILDQSLGAMEYSVVFMVPISAYIHEDTQNKLEMGKNYNIMRIAINGDGKDRQTVEKIAEEYSKKLEKAGFSVYGTSISLTHNHPTADYVDAIANILLVIGILVLFLSGTLIYNTLKAILSNQIRQIGAMKTIGATYIQIVLIYMRLIFIFSVIALIIAIPTSIVAAKFFREFLAESINFKIMRSGIIWESILLQVVLGIIVPQAAGAIPVSKGARTSIQKAMSSSAGSMDNVAKPSRFMTWMSRLFSRPTALSMRNTFRNKSRLILTLFTLALGGAIFIGSFNVNEAIDQHVAIIARYVQGDLAITTEKPCRQDRMEAVLSELPDIARVEGWGSGTARYIVDDKDDGPSVSITAPPANTKLLEPNMKEGRWYKDGEDGVIVLSERFNFTYPELKIGDTITLDINQTGVESDWKVIGFYSMAGKSGGFLAYMSNESFRKYSGSASRVNTFQIQLQENMNGDKLETYKSLIESTLENNGIKVRSVERNDTFVSDAAAGLNILAAFMLIMALLIALVGSIGLTGTMSLNVMERTSEIGIMRAIGASNKAVMRNVLTEGLLIGILSWILGTLLSVPVGIELTNQMGSAIFGSDLTPAFDWVGYVLWLIISIVFSIVASSAPAKTAVNLTIQEVLSVE